MGGMVKASSGSNSPILFWISGTYQWGQVLDLFTGDKTMELAPSLDSDAQIVCTHDDPAPLTILALIYKAAIQET
jgi:hypothetical protein